MHVVFRHDTSAPTRHGFAENATCDCVILGCLKQTASSCDTKIEDKKSNYRSTYSLLCYNHPPTPSLATFSHTPTLSYSLFLSSLAEECAHTAQQKKPCCVQVQAHTHHTDAGGARVRGCTCTCICARTYMDTLLHFLIGPSNNIYIHVHAHAYYFSMLEEGGSCQFICTYMHIVICTQLS